MITKERLEQFLADRAPQLTTTIPTEDTSVGIADVVLLKYQIGDYSYLVSMFYASGSNVVREVPLIPLMVYCPFRSEVFLILSGNTPEQFYKLLCEWYGDRNRCSQEVRDEMCMFLSERHINLLHSHFSDKEIVQRRKEAAEAAGRRFFDASMLYTTYFPAIVQGKTPQVVRSIATTKGTPGGTDAAIYDQYYAAADETAFLKNVHDENCKQGGYSAAHSASLLKQPFTVNFSQYLCTRSFLDMSKVFKKFLAIRSAIVASAPTARTVRVVIRYNGTDYAFEKIPAEFFLDGSTKVLLKKEIPVGFTPNGMIDASPSSCVTEIGLPEMDIRGNSRCKESDALINEIAVNKGNVNLPNGGLNPYLGGILRKRFRIMVTAIKRIEYKNKTLWEEKP